MWDTNLTPVLYLSKSEHLPVSERATAAHCFKGLWMLPKIQIEFFNLVFCFLFCLFLEAFKHLLRNVTVSNFVDFSPCVRRM